MPAREPIVRATWATNSVSRKSRLTSGSLNTNRAEKASRPMSTPARPTSRISRAQPPARPQPVQARGPTGARPRPRRRPSRRRTGRPAACCHVCAPVRPEADDRDRPRTGPSRSSRRPRRGPGGRQWRGVGSSGRGILGVIAAGARQAESTIRPSPRAAADLARPGGVVGERPRVSCAGDRDRTRRPRPRRRSPRARREPTPGDRDQPADRPLHPRHGWHRIVRQTLRAHRPRRAPAPAHRHLQPRRAEAVRVPAGPRQRPARPLLHRRRARRAPAVAGVRRRRHRRPRRGAQAGAGGRVQPVRGDQDQHPRAPRTSSTRRSTATSSGSSR